MSKNIKNSVKKAVKFINDFEKTAADIAISNQYDYVICGHIHHPEIKNITTENGNVVYMNSGDWIENLTALEYHNKEWKLFRYNEEDFKLEKHDEEDELSTLNNSEIFNKMLVGFMENDGTTEIKFKR